MLRDIGIYELGRPFNYYCMINEFVLGSDRIQKLKTSLFSKFVLPAFPYSEYASLYRLLHVMITCVVI